MNVSRETFESFLDHYKTLSPKECLTLFDDPSVLPSLVEAFRGSCLVAEDDCFDMIFRSLYFSSFSGLCTISNIKDEGPRGFLSPVEVSKNAYNLYKENLS